MHGYALYTPHIVRIRYIRHGARIRYIRYAWLCAIYATIARIRYIRHGARIRYIRYAWLCAIYATYSTHMLRTPQRQHIANVSYMQRFS